MKSYDIFDLYHKTLTEKRDALELALDAAEEADRAAWEKYDGLTEEEYNANPREYDHMVEATSKTYKAIKEHLASIQDAITYAARLEQELSFLEEEGVL